MPEMEGTDATVKILKLFQMDRNLFDIKWKNRQAETY